MTLDQLSAALVQTRYEGGIGEFLGVCREASKRLNEIAYQLRTGQLVAVSDDAIERVKAAIKQTVWNYPDHVRVPIDSCSHIMAVAVIAALAAKGTGDE